MLTRYRTYTSEQKTQLILSLVIGLAVVFLYHYLARQEWGDNLVYSAFDKLQTKEAAQATASPPPTTPVRFIDITQK
jgi:hypothetical protein